MSDGFNKHYDGNQPALPPATVTQTLRGPGAGEKIELPVSKPLEVREADLDSFRQRKRSDQ
jgi:hypothetical protein